MTFFRKAVRPMKSGAFHIMVFVSILLLPFSEVRAAGEIAQYRAAPETGISEANGLSAPLYLQRPVMEALPQKQRAVPKFSIVDVFPGLRTMSKQRRVDAVLQAQAVAQKTVALNAIFQGIDFEGLNNINGVLPPDSNCAVGPNRIVQMVNMHFEIWDKAGNQLMPPTPTTQLWQGTGGPCATENDGDGLAIYDQLADRWVMTQFSLNTDSSGNPQGPFYECIAVSQTGDPMGAWYQYAFKLSDTVMNDYPKLAVWPDAYYMTDNQFDTSGNYLGVGAYAFDRNSMLAGHPGSFVYFNLNNLDQNLFSMLPSTLDGVNQPPAGAPNYFVGLGYDPTTGNPISRLEIWTFHVDWNNTANSAFTRSTPLTTAPFDASLCNYGAKTCIPQPDTSQGLDAIPDRVMYRLQYRNFGSYQTMVVNHTVDTNGADHAGIRWYELRKTTGDWFINQQGTYSPDSNSRWVGSIAMDGAGNIALGYSVSSSTVYPSIRYTGRLAADPPGTMSQGEKTLIAGGGSQTDSSGRWGDYSSMVVDPSDDRTFWYTQEYYSGTSQRGWQTRIGSFKIQSNPPALVSLTPSEMTSVAGTAQKFSAVYGDPDGYKGLKTVDFQITNGNNWISVRYNRNSNLLSIYDVTGSELLPGNCTPGSTTVLQNKNGILNCQQTTVAESGDNLTVNWNITPKTAFTSIYPMMVLMKATDKANLTAGPTTMASWTILTADTTPPAVGTLTPSSLSSSAGTPQTLAAVYSDPDGYANLKTVDLRVSPTGSGTNSIWLSYNRNKNLLFIYNGAGTDLVPGGCAPGSAAALENKYGILNCQQTTVSASDPDQNSLTVDWSITPKAAFASSAAKTVRTMARDNSGKTSGWITEGSWAVSQ